MNQERLDEKRARELLSTWTGRILEHADKTGGFDYRSVDGVAAFEVTRITDPAIRRGRDAARKSRDMPASSVALQKCWLVMVPEKQPRMKGLSQRILPLLIGLEEAGEFRFDEQRALHAVRRETPLSEIYRLLLEEGVEHAIPLPAHNTTDESHVHSVHLSPGGGGSASGSEEALAAVEFELNAAVRQDNYSKLRDAGTTERHLFVWVDDDTSFMISRPLREAPQPGSELSFGLPTRPPQVDEAVTHLWLVHERTKHGWLWDGAQWHSIDGADAI